MEVQAAPMPPQEGRPVVASRKPKIPHKWQRVLAAFLAGRSLNRFDGERLSDHCLHSTVSTLQSKGLVILRAPETVAGYMGLPVSVMRYRLAPTSFDLARALVGAS